MLLNYQRGEEQLEENQEFIAASLSEVVCVLSVFAPEVIPEQYVQ